MLRVMCYIVVHILGESEMQSIVVVLKRLVRIQPIML
jgi:hypothetical protein